MKNKIKQFQQELEKESNIQTKRWFDNYLRGKISFRGLKTPQVRDLLIKFIQKNHLIESTEEKQIDFAFGLISKKKAEDKYAGIIYIQKHLLKKVDPNKLLDHIQRAFENGHFFEWSATDWLCTRVLCVMLKKNKEQLVEKISNWRLSSDLWQRRASIVAFLKCVDDGSLNSITESIISTLVQEKERFIQTGIGWFIASLSKKRPQHAELLVEKYFNQLSKEVIQRHTKHLVKHKEYINRKRKQYIK